MNKIGTPSGAGEILGTYPIKMYELHDDFLDQTDDEYVNGAQSAAKASRFAEAGAFVRSIKDEATRTKTFAVVIAILEGLNKTEHSKAYDGMHQFLDNVEMINH